MNKLIYFSLFVLLTGYIAPSTIYPIYIKEYNLYLYPEKGCFNIYKLKSNDSTTIHISLLSCKGAMNVEVYKKGVLVEKGKYINSLTLLREYTNRVGYNNKKDKSVTEIIVSEYYQPLRDSVWLFYNHNIVTSTFYKKGVPQ